eukprot:6560842-Prymnesium_polylepis.1
MSFDFNARIAHSNSSTDSLHVPPAVWLRPHAPSGARHLDLLQWLQSSKQAMQPDGGDTAQSVKGKSRGRSKKDITDFSAVPTGSTAEDQKQGSESCMLLPGSNTPAVYHL